NSTYGHYLNKNIDWKIVKKFLGPLIIGALAGSFVSKEIAADTLELIFSIYVVLVSIKMFMDIKVERELKETRTFFYALVGFLIGFKSTILGIGGGTISIPFLSWRGLPMKKAVGVSASLGVPIAIAGTASYIYNGLGIDKLPEFSLGFVYLPALGGVILTSSYFARLGAKISHKLPQQRMKKGFSLFLMIVAIKMISSRYL
ncbi:MAG: putative membrane protein YfcA, partial [Bacteriovoracaceae bacterium]